MDALKTLMLEGTFSIGIKRLIYRPEGQDEWLDVDDALAELDGRQVRLAVMHVPFDGIQPDRWGGGCCNFEQAGHCPAGHHIDPTRVLVFTCEGTLGRIESEGSSILPAWALTKFDGSIQRVPLGLMAGHTGRILGATTDAVERMRDALAGMDPGQQVEALAGQAGNLKEMLENLKKATGSN